MTPFTGKSNVKQKFLVPVANPANMENLLEFAILIKDNDVSIPVYPLTVVTQRNRVREKINENQEIIQKVIDSLHTEIIF